ncbi:hypothetical protein ACFUMH_04985 [Cellulomonas sp. NPDC057328]|uniref:hypothetical protein n=1 Tax=Cellulomonas sp. NPDC057328 TaxID=3346101 RepID=UPI00363852CD
MRPGPWWAPAAVGPPSSARRTASSRGIGRAYDGRRPGDHTDFDAEELRDDQRRTLLVVEESC